MASVASEEFHDEEHLLGDDEKDRSHNERPSKNVSRAKLLPYSVAFNVVLLLALISTWAISYRKFAQLRILNAVYSPAESAIEYKTVVFTGGLHGDRSAYQGYSEEVNERWNSLFNEIGISQIPAAMAARLPNATTPTAHDPKQYMVELDVFHQLHCLNFMRKIVYPDIFKIDLTPGTEEGEDNVYHLEHCYDQLRQSIQCASDVGTIYWEWSEPKQKMFGNLRTTHTCKNFEKIREWAAQHKLDETFDQFHKVEGAPIRQSN
ncbi:hypothetical protein T069G_09875 [Trichoderma breve]|uniref:Uncharacterized protein n=1 Tax=Trichoderma breve TaxID=2034170 RepID=A0A9W9E4P3_9HYPO|nr:hypothetical protein T069G_09875 [Trichoderma breve]KAJ4856507.1 hypothetical protein T069G_09875 [Trichoderma breve]